MPFFKSFPKTYYDFVGDGAINYMQLIDITKRIAFIKDLQNQTSLYYEYVIKESDTPENIAQRYYGDPSYYWVILLYNNIVDPQLDWPKNERVLYEYLVNKYGLSEINEPHHYTLDIQQIDVNTQTTTEFSYIIDEDTYNDTPASTVEAIDTPTGAVSIITTRSIVTNYDYEILVNEAKRNIKLLKKDYLGIVESNLEKAFQ
jgi:hypothetical protein